MPAVDNNVDKLHKSSFAKPSHDDDDDDDDDDDRDLEFECFYKEGFLSTRTSRTTGEIASHYRHLELGRRGGPSQLVRLVRVVQLVEVHLIIDT